MTGPLERGSLRYQARHGDTDTRETARQQLEAAANDGQHQAPDAPESGTT